MEGKILAAAGIVCEYNPFHRYHADHIRRTKQMCDGPVICVMSGNFVQRGEAAMFSKHSRAEATVRCGADLVLELPLPWAISSAEAFASGGVSILAATGVCSHISFGSECGDIDTLQKTADCLCSDEIDEQIKAELQRGISYASARQTAASRILGRDADVLSSPNDILAIEYLKAINRGGHALRPIVIKREGVQHDGENEENLSASALRRLIKNGERPWQHIPDDAAKIFETELNCGRAPVTLSAMENAMLARLRTMSENDYLDLPGSSEGLHLRLMRYARTKCTLDEIITATKTKRYAMSRIRRMLMCAYLGIRAEDSSGTPPYIRVLAFNSEGQRLLKQMRTSAQLPVIIRPADTRKLGGEAERMMQLEASATDLYTLARPEAAQRAGGEEWIRGPVRV